MDANASFTPDQLTHASDTRHSAGGVVRLPVRKSTTVSAETREISAKPTLADVWGVLDGIAVAFLKHHTDDVAAAKLLECTPDMIRHYRRFFRDGTTGSRPRAGTIFAMCIADPHCNDMAAELLGITRNRSAAVEAAIDNLISTVRSEVGGI